MGNQTLGNHLDWFKRQLPFMVKHSQMKFSLSNKEQTITRMSHRISDRLERKSWAIVTWRQKFESRVVTKGEQGAFHANLEIIQDDLGFWKGLHRMKEQSQLLTLMRRLIDWDKSQRNHPLCTHGVIDELDPSHDAIMLMSSCSPIRINMRTRELCKQSERWHILRLPWTPSLSRLPEPSNQLSLSNIAAPLPALPMSISFSLDPPYHQSW